MSKAVEKSSPSGKSMQRRVGRSDHDSQMSGKSARQRDVTDDDRSVGLRTELQEQFRLLTGAQDSGVNPTRRQAIGSLLLYRREVSESTLVRFQRLQGDDEADVYSMSPRKRSRHLAQNKERSAQRRGQRRSWCGVPIFADRSLFVQLWNVLIIVIDALYTALWVPVVATFELPHRVTTASGATDFCVGLVLCIDIYVRFHAPILLTSTYKSLTLSTPRSIAAFYLVRGSFFLDAAAAIPLVFLPFLSNSSEFVIIILVLRILRLARVKRVIDMLFYIQMMSISGASSVRMVIGSLVGILYTIAVMCNLLACIWYWIGRQSPPDVGWLSQEYKFQGELLQGKCDAYLDELRLAGDAEADLFDCTDKLWFHATDIRLWSISVYFVIVTLTTLQLVMLLSSVGYGDITPASLLEIWTSVVIMITGLTLFANILSSLIEIVQRSSKQARKSNIVRSKLTDVQHWMSQRSLGPKVRSDILRFYAEDWGQLQEEDPSILEDLPTDLAAETIWALVAQDFKNVPLWAELYGTDGAGKGATVTQEDTQKAVAAKMRPIPTTRGTHVAKQGSDADSIFFLQRGTVEVLHLGHSVARVMAPATFGEAALLRDEMEAANKRQSGYRTTSASMLWVLPLEDIDAVQASVPGMHEKLTLGLKKTIYYKLFSMSLPRLKLIRGFLKCMTGDDADKQLRKIEAMLPGLNRSVDMGVVSILSWYDKCAYEAAQTGASETQGGGSPSMFAGAKVGWPGVASPQMGAASQRFSQLVTAVGKLKGKHTSYVPHCVSTDAGRTSTGGGGLSMAFSGAPSQAFPTCFAPRPPTHAATRSNAPSPRDTRARRRWQRAFEAVRDTDSGSAPASSPQHNGDNATGATPAAAEADHLSKAHQDNSGDADMEEFAQNLGAVAEEQEAEAKVAEENSDTASPHRASSPDPAEGKKEEEQSDAGEGESSRHIFQTNRRHDNADGDEHGVTFVNRTFQESPRSVRYADSALHGDSERARPPQMHGSDSARGAAQPSAAQDSASIREPSTMGALPDDAAAGSTGADASHGGAPADASSVIVESSRHASRDVSFAHLSNGLPAIRTTASTRRAAEAAAADPNFSFTPIDANSRVMSELVTAQMQQSDRHSNGDVAARVGASSPSRRDIDDLDIAQLSGSELLRRVIDEMERDQGPAKVV